MTSKEIRQKYLDYFKARGHAILPGASLIPENDSSTLFTSSGMQPLVPYFLSGKHPSGKRLCNSQKSFRAEDIDGVGDGRHNTFFEMLGNWSLGDYFKKEQLEWIFEFLTKEIGLSAKRLYVTVFRGNTELGIESDEESVEAWKNIYKNAGLDAKAINFPETNGMQSGRIFHYDERKNWWSRSGEPKHMPEGEPGGPDSEIFYDLGADLHRHENSTYSGLPCHVNCECGRFIEIGNSVFMEYAKTKNGFSPLPKKIVDFGGGLERISMVSQEKLNVFETDLFAPLIKNIEDLSGKKYYDDAKSFEIIADHLRAATFILSDDKGVVPSNVTQGYMLRRLIRRSIRYGKMLRIGKKGWTIDIAKCVIENYKEIYPELQKNSEFIIEQLYREEEKFNKTLEKGLKEFEKLHFKNTISGVDAFNLYQTYGFPIEMTKELAMEKNLTVDENGYFNELKKHQELSRTTSAGMFKGGLADSTEATKKLHTAAHLLLASLRKILGEHVVQKGSNINAERLRFDFSHKAKLTDEEKQKIELMVNDAIQKKLPVSFEVLPLEKAKQNGAMGVFESKYGEKVKVYKISTNADIFSYEICGGPHAENTGVLGKFKIIKEEGVSSGVRRIKAILEN